VHKGEELPYPSQSFDLVTAIEVIEHVEDGAEEAFLAECHRVLRPTGLFILTTPSWNLPLTAHHFRHYSIERLSSLLEASQFNILDIRGQSIPWKGKKRKLRKIMSRTPKVWHLWKFTYRETRPEKALNLMVAARPINHSQL
jgi:ubiquinone/menaquinone biosynthesis C-methylase UbiE